jgi:hypothetical protein
MKITKQYLVKVIKEELDAAFGEEEADVEEEDVGAPAWRVPPAMTDPEDYRSWLTKERLLALTMINLGKAGFEAPQEDDEFLSPEVLKGLKLAIKMAYTAASENPKINLKLLNPGDTDDIKNEVERLFRISQD